MNHGASAFDWDRCTPDCWNRWYVEFYPRQSILVHDDSRGLSHISSSADLAAFEPRTGRLLWRTALARIAPLKVTQSRYPRKIRVFSTRPLLKDNVAYHVTNAGVVAAVDAQTGDIRWLTRYPQRQNVLDNLAKPGETWHNDAPLIRGHACLRKLDHDGNCLRSLAPPRRRPLPGLPPLGPREAEDGRGTLLHPAAPWRSSIRGDSLDLRPHRPVAAGVRRPRRRHDGRRADCFAGEERS